MKNKSIKIGAVLLACVIGITPVFACTTTPRDINTSKPTPSPSKKANFSCCQAHQTVAPSRGEPVKVKPEPVKQVAPTQPVKQVAPTQPVKQVVPTQPVKQVVPTQPVKQVVPMQPVKQVVPTQPVKQVVPMQPVKQVVPMQPIKQVVPTQPVKVQQIQGAFVIDNFKVIQCTLEKLGISPAELEGMIKQGKTLSDVLKDRSINLKKFRCTLLKQYYCTVTEAVDKGQITKQEAKVLKASIKQKVMSWQPKS